MDEFFNDFDGEELEAYIDGEIESAEYARLLISGVDHSSKDARGVAGVRGTGPGLGGIPRGADGGDEKFDTKHFELQRALIIHYAYILKTSGRPPASVFSLHPTDPRRATRSSTTFRV